MWVILIDAACMSAPLMAKASAMSGEDTWLSEMALWELSVPAWSEKIQARTADPAFQEASVWQTVVKVEIIEGRGRREIRGGIGVAVGRFGLAASHSFIAHMDWRRTSRGADERLSNRSLFLEIQGCQQIQGNKFLTVPTGGSIFHKYEAQSEGLLKDVSAVIEKALVHGPILQTSFAMLQWKRMWSIDSCSPHRVQAVLVENPLFCRFSHDGKAFCATFQRKKISLGRSGGFQICFFQFRSLFTIMGNVCFVWCREK